MVGKTFIVTQGYDERAMKSFVHEWNLMLMKQKMNIMKELQKQKKSWHSHWPKGIRYDVYILDGGCPG